jgi:molecular chaperone DnaK
MALQRLNEAAEKAKIELSNTMETLINLPFLTADASGPKHLEKKLTRAKFESMIMEFVDRSFICVNQALKDAKRTPEQINQVVLVGGSIRIPLIQQRVKDFFKKEVNKSVNPDEVVAIGASLQAGILSKDVNDLVLLDVTPLTLSIETLGNICTPMIKRNTTIPTQKKEIFSTACDNQPSVEIHVLQGERTESRLNRSLGKFMLDGILPAPRGVPKIEVLFDIDASGIINVSAKDLATGKNIQKRIEGGSGLSEEQIKTMVKEAEENAAADKQKQEETERRNKLDSLIYQCEVFIKENKEKIADKVSLIEAAMVDGRKAIEMQDDAKIQESSNIISQLMHDLAKIMYENTDQPNDPHVTPEPQPTSTEKENIVDAEFE